MATIPDQRHAVQALPPRRSGVLRAALGGAALGALIAVAAFQLSSRMKVSDMRESSKIAPAVSLFATPSIHRPAAAVGWLAESPPKPRRKQHPSLAGSSEAARESNTTYPLENGRGRSPANLDDGKAQNQPQPLKGNPQSDRRNQDGFIEDE